MEARARLGARAGLRHGHGAIGSRRTCGHGAGLVHLHHLTSLKSAHLRASSGNSGAEHSCSITARNGLKRWHYRERLLCPPLLCHLRDMAAFVTGPTSREGEPQNGETLRNGQLRLGVPSTMLLDRRSAAARLGVSSSLFTELTADVNPTIPYIRLTPGGQKWWTEEMLQVGIDRLYLDQMGRHLLPERLLESRTPDSNIRQLRRAA